MKTLKTWVITNVPTEFTYNARDLTGFFQDVIDEIIIKNTLDGDDSTFGNLPSNWNEDEMDDIDDKPFEFHTMIKLSAYADTLLDQGKTGLDKLIDEYYEDLKVEIIPNLLTGKKLFDKFKLVSQFNNLLELVTGGDIIAIELCNFHTAIEALLYQKYYYPNYTFANYSDSLYKNILTRKELSEINPDNTWILKFRMNP